MTASSTTTGSSDDRRLLSAIESIAGPLELDALWPRILAAACRLVDASEAAIAIVTTNPATLVVVGSTGGGALAPGALIERSMLERRRPRAAAVEGAAPGGMLVPIRSEGEPVAALQLVFGSAPRATSDVDSLLSDFSPFVAAAIAGARRFGQALRRASRFELIARIGQIINAGLELDSLLQKTADAIHEMLGFPNVDIPLLDPEDPSTLVVAVRGGHYKRMIKAVDRIPISTGIMGAAVRERRSVRVDDVSRDPRYVQPPVDTQIRAELAVPIVVGTEVLGVVNVEGDSAFDELDQRTVESVADHLGIAIQNARLIERDRAAAVWQERQRLGRELHDSVTQILSSISLLAQALPSAWRASPADGERGAERLAELAQTAFAEMRVLLRELHPPQRPAQAISGRGRSFLGLERLRDRGLPDALQRLLEVMLPEGLRRDFRFAGYTPQVLALEEALYRVCQEAVSNVIRHACAHSVVVEARVDATQVWLEVVDDGCGLPDNVNPGIGLKSMRQRVVGLGGQLHLRPGEPRGLVVQATVPRRDRELETP